MSNLLPPMRGRAKGVSQAYVFSMGEQLLHRFGVPFHELTKRLLILLDQLIDIVYSRHLEITSIVDTSSFRLPPCDHPTLFIGVRGKRILGNLGTEVAPDLARWHHTDGRPEGGGMFLACAMHQRLLMGLGVTAFAAMVVSSCGGGGGQEDDSAADTTTAGGGGEQARPISTRR